MEVQIPFMPKFKDKMLNGNKTYTTRTGYYGHAGDTFSVFGAQFKILAVHRLKLAIVAQDCYRPEGFDNPDAFIECWKQIHPRAGWTPDKLVWVYSFRRAD